jgi:hypothetical protein
VSVAVLRLLAIHWVRTAWIALLPPLLAVLVMLLPIRQWPSEPSWQAQPEYHGPPVMLDLSRSYHPWCPYFLVFTVPGPGFQAEMDGIHAEGNVAVLRATLWHPRLPAVASCPQTVEATVNALDPLLLDSRMRGSAIEVREVWEGSNPDATPWIRAMVRHWSD